eukprot:m.137759 g.137759  ORF g.137759 m.137759 type:complete len:124 (+) comp12305_c0_seq1:110-481(+)
MKLLTQNMLKSHVKGVKLGYPLRLEAEKIEMKEVEYNQSFIVKMLDRIKYNVLYSTAQSLDMAEGLPELPPDNAEDNDAFLRAVHHVLLEIEIVEGKLICPETEREFPIKKGIPNMLLNEDEV